MFLAAVILATLTTSSVTLANPPLDYREPNSTTYDIDALALARVSALLNDSGLGASDRKSGDGDSSFLDAQTLDTIPKILSVEESPSYASSVVLASDLLSLTSAVSNVKERVCREQGYRFLDGLLLNKRWALKMFDASAKSPQGLLFGSSYHLGNFDECVGIEDESSNRKLAGKYCLATINWPQSGEKKRNGRTGELRWAVCVPNTCGADELGRFVQHILARTVGNTTRVQVSDRDCYTRKPISVSKLDIGFLAMIFFFGVILSMSTTYEVISFYRSKQKKTIIYELIISFSIIKNMKKILSTKQPNGLGLDCVAGMKTLAMVFITGGHACLFIASGPVMDADAWDRLVKHPANAFMLNNALLVDTFLMLSAFLFCRLLLIELDKRNGKLNVIPILIFRYIRVTPAYLVVILFYMTWLTNLGEGPLWEDKVLLEKERCLHSWWTNLLYINNYVNTDQLCMFQSWYLSVDTQLFFVAPIFIFALWKWRRMGPAILAVAIVVSALLPAFITYYQKLDPTLLFYAKEFKDISLNTYFRQAYMKTHMRLTPYFIGLFVGYLLHRIQLISYEFTRSFKIVAWLLSIVLGSSATFCITLFYQDGYTFNQMDSASYAGLHKVAWCTANGWLIIACATGNGGPLEKLLKWKFLVPLSRLTFCAYLVNGIVELYYVGTIRHPLHISFFNVVANAIAHIILTFFLAIILCVTFESPIHGLEKILLRIVAKPVLSDNARPREPLSEPSSRCTSQSKLES